MMRSSSRPFLARAGDNQKKLRHIFSLKGEKKEFSEASRILQSVIENLADDSFISTKIEAYYQLGEIEMVQEKYANAINYYTLAHAANTNNKTDFSITKRILKQ